MKKSFQYGLEDIKNDSSQMLNLNITKHNESVREAPLSNCNSMKAQMFEAELNMVSEIRAGKPVDSFEKHGIDNSLSEVMKVFRDNEKKNCKGNFGWKKAVQHTTIRLNEVVQEANRIERKGRHQRSSSKMSVRSSLSRSRLLFDNTKFGVRQSQNFNDRMHHFQQSQFGNRASSRKSIRGISPGTGFHSK